MFTLFILVAGYGAWRAARTALAAWRDLPRDNQDMIFY